MSDLESVFDGEPEVEETVQETVQEDVQETVEATEEPTGEEETSPPEVETKSDPIEGLKAGISAERQKRQEAEMRARQLEQQMTQTREKPDFWENPEAVLNGMAQGFQSQMQEMKTNMSVEFMRTTYDDYDEMEATFIDMAQQNPMLVQEMNKSGNPAKFAYDTAKAQKEISEMRDPSYKDKLRAEIKAELEAEYKASLETEIQKRSSLPGTLSNDRAAGGNIQQSWSQPSAESLYD